VTRKPANVTLKITGYIIYFLKQVPVTGI